MPLITEETGNGFLKSSRNILLKKIVDDARANAEGVVNLPLKETNPAGKVSKIPDGMRAIIGAVSKVVGPKEAAEQFGISIPTAHHIEHGHRGTNHDVVDRKDVKKLDRELEPIRQLAIDKMKNAILAITEDKLESSKATELASVARSMSGIVKDMNPESKDGGEKYQFNIFAPQVVNESHYTTVEA